MAPPPARHPEPQSAARVAEVLDRLEALYGPPDPARPGDPLAELIGTVLSQHTSDRNSELAFRRLWQRYGSWRAVRDAPVAAIAEAIRPGGLAEVKAPRIKLLLERLTAERGEPDLDFLRELPTETARAYLERLPGVGPKTAACVLLFALGRPVIPVDTHVQRVARRLGLAGPKATAEAVERALEAIVPPERRHAAHLLLITHGRRICRAPMPRCSDCPLLDLCPRVGVPGGPVAADRHRRPALRPGSGARAT